MGERRYKVYSFGAYIGIYAEEKVMEMIDADRRNVRAYGENGKIRNGQWKIVREDLMPDDEFKTEWNRWCKVIRIAPKKKLRAALGRMKAAAQ